MAWSVRTARIFQFSLLVVTVHFKVDSFSSTPKTATTGRRMLQVAIPTFYLQSLSRIRRPFVLTAIHNDSRDSMIGVRLPLLDLTNSEEYWRDLVLPLPSSHLPDELRTVSVYTMELKYPLHRVIVQYAIDDSDDDASCSFGFLASHDGPLVGAIGCAAQIVTPAAALANLPIRQEDGVATPSSQTFVYRGSFRFVVKKVLQEIPFPIVLVDELNDSDDIDPGLGKDDVTAFPGIDCDDEVLGNTDGNRYSKLSGLEKVETVLNKLEEYCQIQMDAAEREMSPLEEAILVDQGLSGTATHALRLAAEEVSAVFQVFQITLVDLFAELPGRYYAVAMMAAEICNMSNHARQIMLQMTNGRDRLAYVLKELDEAAGMARARKIAQQITDESDEASKDLKVGEPQLPPWAKSICAGTKLEYFWNEDVGWCSGEVVKDPILIVDEILLTVLFDDDGTTHRLPFTADEKLRWRPQ
jgi:hypothetical protein